MVQVVRLKTVNSDYFSLTAVETTIEIKIYLNIRLLRQYDFARCIMHVQSNLGVKHCTLQYPINMIERQYIFESKMRLIIYTGKGGTGKTVVSCSTGIALANKKYRTLVISSDPAHTLGDAFQMSKSKYDGYNKNDDANDEEPIKSIIPYLYILQVDPIREMSKQYNNVLSYMASLYSSRGLDETLSYELAMMPGMTQLFSLLKAEEVIRNNSFDVIVLDMPASGEALRYLYFPKLIGGIGKKLTGLMGAFSSFSKIFQSFSGISMPDNSILQFEQDLFGRFNYLSELIRNNSVTSLRLIANPDTFSIENAKRSLMSASLYGINVDLVIINKIMPPIADGSGGVSNEYYENWRKFQGTKVEEAKTSFYPVPVKEVYLHSSELAGIVMLRANANNIFKNGDPADIFYEGKPYSIIQETSNRLRIILKVPFTEKGNFDIKRSGTQVSIKVKTATGFLVNVIPLPSITFNMDMINAELDNGILTLTFEKST
jgi:arsenite-transporting ATPase